MLPLTDRICSTSAAQEIGSCSFSILFLSSIIALKTVVLLQKNFTIANVEANLFIGFDRMITDNF